MLRAIFKNTTEPVRAALRQWELPYEAKAELARDRAGLPAVDPGPDRVVRAGLQWLGRAQDASASRDGGVARHYGFAGGWATSYPETTGYIVPTMLAGARHVPDPALRRRAKRMLDWLASIQLPCGGFQGGTVDATPVVPVTFNTGQVLLGLASGVAEFGDEYREPMRAAADWLVATQDADGCWRRHPTPFAVPGEKTYETHVAWGLFEAARLDGSRGYGEAALKNTQWALSLQRENGWFEKCCVSAFPSQPFTHTIGYVLRGLVEAYRFSREPELLAAADRTAMGLLSALKADGSLPGRLNARWQGTVPWVCLAGSAQIAICWLMLSGYAGNRAYRDGARLASQFVRRTIQVQGHPDTTGAVKGAFPFDGGYGTYEYLSWGCKFVVDLNLLELQLDAHAESGLHDD